MPTSGTALWIAGQRTGYTSDLRIYTPRLGSSRASTRWYMRCIIQTRHEEHHKDLEYVQPSRSHTLTHAVCRMASCRSLHRCVLLDQPRHRSGQHGVSARRAPPVLTQSESSYTATRHVSGHGDQTSPLLPLHTANLVIVSQCPAILTRSQKRGQLGQRYAHRRVGGGIAGRKNEDTQLCINTVASRKRRSTPIHVH